MTRSAGLGRTWQIWPAGSESRWHIIDRLQKDYKKSGTAAAESYIMWNHLAEILQGHDDGFLFVFGEPKVMYGYCVFVNDKPRAEIKFLHVFSEYARRGIGSAVVQALRKQVKCAHKLFLYSAQSAQVFWEKQSGFSRSIKSKMRFEAKGLKK